MSSKQRMTIKTGAALAVMMGLAFTAQADVLTWDDGYGLDSRIDRDANWDPTGLPTVGVNSGVVNGSYATTYYNNQTPAYEIAYNNTSSLSGATAGAVLYFSNGADFTFKDSSTLTVGGSLYTGSGNTSTGPGALTLTGNATATAGSLRFGYGGPTGTDYSGSLTLRGNSTLTTSGVMYWQQRASQDPLTHTITLADSAALTVNNDDVASKNSATLVVNFEQADNLYTPTWTLGEAADFNLATIQYQINGETATLSDERFVQEGNSLSLTVIPEPAAIGMLGLGAITTLLLRRLSTR